MDELLRFRRVWLSIFTAFFFGCLFVAGCDRDEESSNLNLIHRSEITRSGTPIPVRTNGENNRKRCETNKLYDVPEPHEDTPEYHLCKSLQKRLNKAAWDGNVEAIRTALEDGANVRAGYYQQGTPLHLAVIKGRMAAVELLIENGADVNEDYIFGSTALKMAAYYNFPDIAKLLIETGADICSNQPNDFNKRLTALDIAKEEGHSSMIHLLKSAGADRCP